MTKNLRISHRKAPSLASQIMVVYRPIDQLKPDPNNPRRHSKRQVRQIADSIKAFGFNVPILIDRDGNIIAGHGRCLACPEIGITEVPTLCLDHLSPAQARAFMIADNRLSEIATWDDRLLAQQLKDLSLLGLDFSLELTGFQMPEIDLRIASLDDPQEATEDPADVLPELPASPPVSQVGDIWQLHRHRLLCGSALDAAGFAALMGGERAAMAFTDPPYNVPIDGHASGLGAIHHRPFPMASGEMDRSEFTASRPSPSEPCRFQRRRVLALHLHGLAAPRSAAGRRPRRLRRAEKSLCLGQGQWRYGVALPQPARACLRLQTRPKRAPQQRPARPVRAQPQQYLELPGGQSFSRRGDEGNLLALHPTVKPVAMVADAILDCSARGDIVLDAFVGSGTTLIAAERTGRRCRGLELDLGYADTTIRRWQALTGNGARHAVSGRSLDDLAREGEAANAA